MNVTVIKYGCKRENFCVLSWLQFFLFVIKKINVTLTERRDSLKISMILVKAFLAVFKEKNNLMFIGTFYSVTEKTLINR